MRLFNGIRKVIYELFLPQGILCPMCSRILYDKKTDKKLTSADIPKVGSSYCMCGFNRFGEK